MHDQLIDEILRQLKEAMHDPPLLVDACRSFLTDQLNRKLPPDQVVKAFLEAMTKDPGKFLDMTLLATKTADKLWADLLSELGSNASKLDASTCRRKLFEEIKSGSSPQQAVNNLFEAIKVSPYHYLNIPSQPTYRPRESTDKGAIGHDRCNVRTLSPRQWELEVAMAFITAPATAVERPLPVD